MGNDASKPSIAPPPPPGLGTDRVSTSSSSHRPKQPSESCKQHTATASNDAALPRNGGVSLKAVPSFPTEASKTFVPPHKRQSKQHIATAGNDAVLPHSGYARQEIVGSLPLESKTFPPPGSGAIMATEDDSDRWEIAPEETPSKVQAEQLLSEAAFFDASSSVAMTDQNQDDVSLSSSIAPSAATAASIAPLDTKGSEMARRVEALVAGNSPLDACYLPQMYFDAYKSPLDYKQCGYKKLKDLVESLPSVQIAMNGSYGNIMMLIWRGNEVPRVGPAPELPSESSRGSRKIPSVGSGAARVATEEDEADHWENSPESLPKIHAEQILSQSAFFATSNETATVRSHDDGSSLTSSILPSGNSDETSEAALPPEASNRSETARRVEALIASNSPLDAAKLPQMYFETYKAPLDCKQFGYKKLKGLLEALPYVKLTTAPRGPPLTLTWCGKEKPQVDGPVDGPGPLLDWLSELNAHSPESQADYPPELQADHPPESQADHPPEPQTDHPPESQAESYPWLEAAVDLWVKRAIRASESANIDNEGDLLPVNNFEYRLVKEAQKSKKLRPDGIPDAKTYVRQVTRRLRQDTRLVCKKGPGPQGYQYWSADLVARSKEADSQPETVAEFVEEFPSITQIVCPDDTNPTLERGGQLLVASEKAVAEASTTSAEEVPAITPTVCSDESSPASCPGAQLLVGSEKAVTEASTTSAEEVPATTPIVCPIESNPVLESGHQLASGSAIASPLQLQPAADIWIEKLRTTFESRNKVIPGVRLPLRNFQFLVYDEARRNMANGEGIGGFANAEAYTRAICFLIERHPRVRCEKRAGEFLWWWLPTPSELGALPTELATPLTSNSHQISTADSTEPANASPSPGLGIHGPGSSKPDVSSVAPVGEGESNHLDLSDKIGSYFAPDLAGTNTKRATRVTIGDSESIGFFEEATLFGRLQTDAEEAQEPIYLNTHEPFCLATIGVQGAGKSHSLACVLEGCLLPFRLGNVSKLQKPMTALVLHYDQNTTSKCEAAGLLSSAPALREHAQIMPDLGYVPASKATVLVSPTYYKQRKAVYGDDCTVRPLLFRWRSLTADHIKRIMRIGTNDNQLYVASCLSLLRKYQREDVVPKFTEFIEEIKEVCNVNGQQGPLGQRIALLESVVAESEENKSIVEESMDVSLACSAGLNLIVVDLSDPLLSRDEANGLFQVITEQFRSVPTNGGKLLALDEAHKFMVGDDTDGLSQAVVNVARLMRHDGVRLAVSTQSPKALAPELLELVSVAVLHKFHSQDWWTYLRRKLPLPDDTWDKILSLRPGNAMLFAASHSFHKQLPSDDNGDDKGPVKVLPIRVRPRLTADLGESRTNM